MSAAVLARVLNLRKISPHLKLVLLVMANNAQDDDGFCHMSMEWLRECTGLTKVALKAALLEAERRKVLILDREPGAGMVLSWRIAFKH